MPHWNQSGSARFDLTPPQIPEQMARRKGEGGVRTEIEHKTSSSSPSCLWQHSAESCLAEWVHDCFSGFHCRTTSVYTPTKTQTCTVFTSFLPTSSAHCIAVKLTLNVNHFSYSINAPHTFSFTVYMVQSEYFLNFEIGQVMPNTTVCDTMSKTSAINSSLIAAAKW